MSEGARRVPDVRRRWDFAIFAAIPAFRPVIPAKAGIQTDSAKPAARNQVRIASDKSLPF